MNAPTDWVSAIAILAAGLVLGLVLFVFFRKRSAQTLGSDADLELRDLEEKRDALIAQLRDLDSDSRLTPDQIAAERSRLEIETAGVLRQLDGAGRSRPLAATSAETADTAPESTMNPALKGFLWGAASFAVLFGIGWFVMKSASPREEGGSPTGGMMAQQQQQGGIPQKSAMVLGLEQAVEKDPDNLQLRNDLAQAYLESDNLMGVFEQTKYVLERTPNDARAMTFQGLVRMAMGEGEAAVKMLEQATKLDPKNLDAWVALAWSHAQQNRMKEAEAMIAEAVKQAPAQKAQLEDVFRQMKQHVESGAAQQMASGAASGELPAGHPPVEGMEVPQAAAQGSGMARPAPPADGKSVKVTLELDPAARSKNGILYVMARNPGGGPPVAVKRLQVSEFPITFDFGSADSMMGQPLPAKFRLEARLDSDGDAATKPPTDPSAVQNDVAPGTSLKLALK